MLRRGYHRTGSSLTFMRSPLVSNIGTVHEMETTVSGLGHRAWSLKVWGFRSSRKGVPSGHLEVYGSFPKLGVPFWGSP